MTAYSTLYGVMTCMMHAFHASYSTPSFIHHTWRLCAMTYWHAPRVVIHSHVPRLIHTEAHVIPIHISYHSTCDINPNFRYTCDTNPHLIPLNMWHQSELMCIGLMSDVEWVRCWVRLMWDVEWVSVLLWMSWYDVWIHIRCVLIWDVHVSHMSHDSRDQQRVTTLESLLMWDTPTSQTHPLRHILSHESRLERPTYFSYSVTDKHLSHMTWIGTLPTNAVLCYSSCFICYSSCFNINWGAHV